MPSDDHLYGNKRQRRMNGEKELKTDTSLSFASQLGSLINSKDNGRTSSGGSAKHTAQKDDIFTAHTRNKKARKVADSQQPIGQKHTVDGGAIDSTAWDRAKRKMEDKARMYAAMKRGDIEDEAGRYDVDFDRKWTEHDGAPEDLSPVSDDDNQAPEIVEYLDEFGRTRKGTRTDAAKAQRQQRGQADLTGDRFTARPVAPAQIIYGDTVQHQAFNPDAHIEAQMAAIAKKRDRSLTPPPDQHFDSAQEIRQKGTGFFAFSGNAEERKRQMDNLETERATTERIRREREAKLRQEVMDRDREFQEDDGAAQSKRKANEFLADLAEELDRKKEQGMDAMQRIEAALANEKDDI